MTWIPCGFCRCAPCQCTFPATGAPQYTPPLPACPPSQNWQSGWLTFGQPPRLSDEDIERIAKRLKELLAKDEP